MSDESSPTQTENRQSRQQRTGVAHHAGNADSQWLAVTSFPDYCRVGDKVIGFDTTATLDNPVTYSPNVIAAGHKVYRVGDLCRGTLGNAGEGLESGTSQGSGHVLITSGQDNVNVNGQPIARHGSECMINCDANGVGGAKGYLTTRTGNVSSTAAATNAPPTEAELLQQQAEENLERADELRETLNDNPNGKTLEDAQALKAQVEALTQTTQQQEQAVIDAYRNGDLTDDELLEVMANTDEAANRANDLRAEAERQALKANAGSNIKAAGKFALETFTPWGTVVDIKDTAALFGQGRYIAGTGMAILTAISLFPPARIVRKTAEGADAVGDTGHAANRADEVPNKGDAPDSTNQPSGSSGGSGEPQEGVQVAGRGDNEVSDYEPSSSATRREIKNARQRGVNRAKSEERELVKNGHPGTADDGGWSFSERKRIAETGQYPSDTRWHHINDVKRNPEVADVPDNVIPSRGGTAGHVRKYHPSGTQSGSSGKVLDRKKLLEDHLKGVQE